MDSHHYPLTNYLQNFCFLSPQFEECCWWRSFRCRGRNAFTKECSKGSLEEEVDTTTESLFISFVTAAIGKEEDYSPSWGELPLRMMGAGPATRPVRNVSNSRQPWEPSLLVTCPEAQVRRHHHRAGGTGADSSAVKAWVIPQGKDP